MNKFWGDEWLHFQLWIALACYETTDTQEVRRRRTFSLRLGIKEYEGKTNDYILVLAKNIHSFNVQI